MKFFFSNNIPNPYNSDLFSSLREGGISVAVAYERCPEREGRLWSYSLMDGEVIVERWFHDRRTFEELGRASSSAFLSGGYRTLRQVRRKKLALGLESPVHWWGERLRRPFSALALRRRMFAGFDSIFAIGTWAAPGYRAVVSATTPVHILPYTTRSHSLSVAEMAPSPLIGFVGSLVERKGLDIVLRALASLAPNRRPQVQVVGSGPMRREWESQARSAGLSMEWLGDLSTSELNGVRRRWWVQVTPSRYDGWGVVVPEALGAGVPVLVSDMVGAGHDLIRNGFNGETVKACGWADAIERWTGSSRPLGASEHAHIVGEAFSSTSAANWLQLIIAEAPTEAQSFPEYAWNAVKGRTDVPETQISGTVVLNWEQWALTRRAVESLPVGGTKVVVVDNGSAAPASPQDAAAIAERADVIFSPTNVGFSAGCNIGMRHLFEDPNVEIVVLMNNDATLTSGAWRRFLEARLDPSVGLMGVAIYHEAEPAVLWYAGGSFNPIALRGRVKGWGVSADRTKVRAGPTGFVTGAFMGIPRRTFERVGGLPEEFFFGGEEWDYSVRVKRAGFVLHIDPTVSVSHLVDGSHSNSAIRYVYSSFRSRLLLARRLALPPAYFRLWYVGYALYARTVLPARLAKRHPNRSTKELRYAAKLALRDAVNDRITLADLDRAEFELSNLSKPAMGPD